MLQGPFGSSNRRARHCVGHDGRRRVLLASALSYTLTAQFGPRLARDPWSMKLANNVTEIPALGGLRVGRRMDRRLVPESISLNKRNNAQGPDIAASRATMHGGNGISADSVHAHAANLETVNP